MTWSATILRGGDDLDVKPFEPVTSAGTILVDSTGETGVTSQTVLRKLASIDNALGVAIQEGSVVQVYNGSAWYDDTPSLAFGPMLVREIACVEHPEQPDLWKVDYMASSFGPILTAESATIGSPQISVGVVSRPRMAAAYRADVIPPADVIATDAFTTAPWQTGNDIAGKKVDINTSPVSIPIDQTIITITWVLRWPFQNWASAWVGPDGNALTISLDQIAEDYVGGRNTTAFMGFPIGSLLMESVEFQPLHHEFKTAVMTLIYDEWHHAQQMPLVNPQFSIPTTPDPTTAMSHTTTVLWNQTFWAPWKLETTNPFFGAAEWDYLTTVFVAGP
tara:strand:+ start:835 stop:1836 length:1002 start_codon:yes stop_codon:yes gene_type:complete